MSSEPSSPPTNDPVRTRQDLRALWVGLAASFLWIGVIWALGERLSRFPHLEDQGPSWYFWKLPVVETVARITAWGGYWLHLLALWAVIFFAQRRAPQTAGRLHNFNWWALGINGLFALLHLVQTHLWYDGLAQDVSIWSSQNSVIALLVLVLLMENQRRGLFWGKKLPLPRQAANFIRTYHGYYFSWAVIYTFWYHPMESTQGHLVGFFYMALLMLQGSLFFTRVHGNRYWTIWLEVMVFFHGTAVAFEQGGTMLPMFGFGFAGIWVITQMHGLNLHRHVRLGFLLLYLGAIAAVYSERGVARLEEPPRIPVAEYLLVALVALLIFGIVKLAGLIKKQPGVGVMLSLVALSFFLSTGRDCSIFEPDEGATAQGQVADSKPGGP